MLDLPKPDELIDDIFAQALAVPETERSSLICDRCGDNETVKRGVMLLLGAHDRLGSFLREPPNRGFSLAGQCAVGDVIGGRFEIREFLGTGGMGEVYQAFDRDVGEVVALKCVRENWTGDEAARSPLRREVRSRAVAHPNICPLYDLYTERHKGRDVVFITMRYLRGETLDRALARHGPFPLHEARILLSGIAEGLDALHHAGFVHRDLKPGNVMLVPDESASVRPIITDFGLAQIRQTAGQATSTHSAAIVGSPAYMAPEQFLDAEVTPAADIFALGAMAFEMVAGSRPYPDETLFRAALRRLTGSARQLSEVLPQAPPAWNAAIARALDREPTRRPPSAGAFLTSLSDCVTFPAARLSRRHLLTGSGIIGTGVSLVFAISRLHKQRPQISGAPVIMLATFSYDNSRENQESAPLLSLLLGRQLQQSSYITVVPREETDHQRAIMSAARKAAVKATVAADAREIALRCSANAVLFGSLTTAGESRNLNLSLELLGNTAEHAMSEFTRSFPLGPATQTISGVSSAILDSAAWVRSTLGEHPDEIAAAVRPPQDLTTSNWEALREYTEAIDLASRHRMDEAIVHLKIALQIDPEFALAAARVGDYSRTMDREDESFKYWLMANRLLVKRNLTDRESLNTRGNFALDTNQPALAEQTLRLFTLDFPADARGYFELATAQQRLGENAEAVASFEQAIRLRPASTSPRYRLAEQYLYMGQVLKAESEWRTVRNIDRVADTWGLQIGIGCAVSRLDRQAFELRLDELSRADDTSRCRALKMRACAAAEAEDLSRATGFAQQALATVDDKILGNLERANCLILLAQLHLEREPSTSAKFCRQVLDLDVDYGPRTRAACILVRLGPRWIGAAREAQRANDVRVKALDSAMLGLPVYGWWRTLFDAECLLSEGNSKDALRRLLNASQGLDSRAWNEALYRVAAAADDKATVRRLASQIWNAPGRYWIEPALTGPGFAARLAGTESAGQNPQFTYQFLEFWKG